MNADECRVARLATVDADGRPHVVPICFALDGDTLYTAVDAKPKSTRALRRLDNIESDPRVEIVIDHDARGLELLEAKYPQYRDDPPAGPFVVVEIEGRTGWQAAQ